MYRSVLMSILLALPAVADLSMPKRASADESQLDPKPQIVDRIARLKSNEAVLIGDASVVGEFNDTARKYNLHQTGPRGRDFTLKMCWAADRKRALFCGANHGVPHRLNDVWEFDLPSLSWNLLYAPDLPRGYTDLGKDTSDVEFRNGILYTRRGGPAVIAHTWWGLTYDPVQKSLLFMNTWVTKRKQAVSDLGGDPTKLYEGPPLWSFRPSDRRWEPLKADKPYPRPIFGGMLEFVPELGGSIWHANNWQMQATWLRDSKTGKWHNLKANGEPKSFSAQSPRPEQIGYYDPKRRMLVVQRHHDTHHFDVKKKAWTKVLAGNHDDGLTPYGHDARSVFYHDPHNGDGLLVQFQTNSIWSYNPDQHTWTKHKPNGDAMLEGKKRLAYFDPAMNVMVVIDRTKVWAYRYRDVAASR